MSFIIPLETGKGVDFESSEYNIDQVVLTDWISFLPSNLRVEINPNPEALSAKPKTFNQHEIAEKANDHLGIKALI